MNLVFHRVSRPEPLLFLLRTAPPGGGAALILYTLIHPYRFLEYISGPFKAYYPNMMWVLRPGPTSVLRKPSSAQKASPDLAPESE